MNFIAQFIMYHAQIINGGRYAEIRAHDPLLGACILYFDFLIMYLLSFQSAKKWSDKCDSTGIHKFVIDNELPK